LGLPDPTWGLKKPAEILTTLHDQGVSIINWNAPPKVFDGSAVNAPNPKGEPESAIEDFGLDYGDDSEETTSGEEG
jgi:hypothetical protein